MQVWLVERVSDGWILNSGQKFQKPDKKLLPRMYKLKQHASGVITSLCNGEWGQQESRRLVEQYGVDYWRHPDCKNTRRGWYDLSPEEKEAFKNERYLLVPYVLIPDV